LGGGAEFATTLTTSLSIFAGGIRDCCFSTGCRLPSSLARYRTRENIEPQAARSGFCDYSRPPSASSALHRIAFAEPQQWLTAIA